MASLTPTQHNILLWLTGPGDRLLYGPMSDGLGMRRSCGFSGSSVHNSVRFVTFDKLAKAGLIGHVKDKYPLGYWTITNAGRAALAKAEGR